VVSAYQFIIQSVACVALLYIYNMCMWTKIAGTLFKIIFVHVLRKGIRDWNDIMSLE